MSQAEIHPTAVVEDGAIIGAGCKVGPFCLIGPQVSLGDNCILESHVAVAGQTTIGDSCHIFPFASLGHEPQDLKFEGEESRLEIGPHNSIREHVTMNPGTKGDHLLTKVGAHGLFMVGSHVAHDCVVGDHVVLANNATLGGHCVVGDHVILGGLSGVHQFVRIGTHAFVGGMSGLENDLIPYGVAMGVRSGLHGLNLVGLKRRGFNRATIHTLRKAYRLLFADEGTLLERLADVEKMFPDEEAVQTIAQFIHKSSGRSLCVPKK